MAINLPYEDNLVDFIPFGAPVASAVDNEAPRQLKADIEFTYGLVRMLSANPLPEWSVTETYWEGQISYDSNGNMYRSLIDNNTNILTLNTAWYDLNMTIDQLGHVFATVNVTGDYTASPLQLLNIDTNNNITVTLPTSPSNGDVVILRDISHNAQNIPTILTTTDKTLLGTADTDISLDVSGFVVWAYFNGVEDTWNIINL